MSRCGLIKKVLDISKQWKCFRLKKRIHIQSLHGLSWQRKQSKQLKQLKINKEKTRVHVPQQPNKNAVDAVNLTTFLLCFALCTWNLLCNTEGCHYEPKMWHLNKAETPHSSTPTSTILTGSRTSTIPVQLHTRSFFSYEQVIAAGGNNNKTDANVNIAVALGFTDTTAKRQRAQ